jgi:hypothetical protein
LNKRYRYGIAGLNMLSGSAIPSEPRRNAHARLSDTGCGKEEYIAWWAGALRHKCTRRQARHYDSTLSLTTIPVGKRKITAPYTGNITIFTALGSPALKVCLDGAAHTQP